MRNNFHGCVMANSPVSHSGSSNSNAHKLNVGYIHFLQTKFFRPLTFSFDISERAMSDQAASETLVCFLCRGLVSYKDCNPSKLNKYCKDTFRIVLFWQAHELWAQCLLRAWISPSWLHNEQWGEDGGQRSDQVFKKIFGIHNLANLIWKTQSHPADQQGQDWDPSEGEGGGEGHLGGESWKSWVEALGIKKEEMSQLPHLICIPGTSVSLVHHREW